MAEERKFIARLQITGAAQVKSEAEQAARGVEQAGTRMQAAWQRIGGQADGLESGFKKLNRGVNDARGAIELIGVAIPGLEGTFGTLTRTIGNVSDVFGTLSALFLRNPIGLAATAVAGLAAAYLLLSKNANEAAEEIDQSSSAASAAATDWMKLAEPLKTVAALLDQVKAKQIEAVGGPRNAIELAIGQQRAEAARLRQQIESVAVPEPSSLNRQGQERLPQEMAAARLRERQLNRQETANARSDLAALEAQLKKTETEIKRLELEERRLRDLEATFGEIPADRGSNLRGAREGLRANADLLSEQGKAAAGEQQKQLDALLSKYAPAIKAEEELGKAREQAIELAERGVISGREYEQVIAGIADAEFKATEEGQRRIELERQAAAVIEEVKTAQERYAEAIERTNELQRAGLITEEQANRKRDAETKKLERTQNELSDEAKRTRDNARELGLAFSSAFEDAIVNGKKVQDVIKGLGQDLLRVFIRRQLTEPLLELFSVVATGGKKGESGGGFGGILETIFGGIFRIGTPGTGGGVGTSIFSQGLYADGAAFHRGNVIPFARGGIVERPTIFPMARGMGLMGEAGPEAVMPLARDSQGRLGVRGGGQAIVINQNIDARNADASIRRELPAMMERTKRETIAAVEMLLDKGGNFSRKAGRRSA